MKIQHINFFKLQKKKNWLSVVDQGLLTFFSPVTAWAARFPANPVTGPCLTAAPPFLKEVGGCLGHTTKEMNQLTGLSQGMDTGIWSHILQQRGLQQKFLFRYSFCRKFLRAVVKRLERNRDMGKSLKTDGPYLGPQEWPVPALVHTRTHTGTHAHTCPPQVQGSLSPTRGHKKWTLSYAITLPSGRVDLNLRTGYFSGPHCLKLDWPPLGHQWSCCSPKAWPSKAPRSASGWSIWTASLNRIPRASPVTSSQ